MNIKLYSFIYNAPESDPALFLDTCILYLWEHISGISSNLHSSLPLKFLYTLFYVDIDNMPVILTIYKILEYCQILFWLIWRYLDCFELSFILPLSFFELFTTLKGVLMSSHNLPFFSGLLPCHVVPWMGLQSQQ